MSIYEARLMAMIDPHARGGWDLSDDDRSAIRWMLDAFEKVKAERDEVRSNLCRELHRHTETLKKLEQIAADATAAAADARNA
jgi:hypothetical protein